MIGVEVTLKGNGTGSVRFYKNDQEVAAGDLPASRLRRGVRPACHVGGAGDAVAWRGEKRREKCLRTYAPDRPDGAASYEGGFGRTGARHGERGVLRYRHCSGFWVGPWVRDKRHGIRDKGLEIRHER